VDARAPARPSSLFSKRLFVLVGGPPASGKSTLAAPLAVELSLPLIAKDAIKEALMDALGPPRDVEESRRLGRAAVMAMLTVARTSPGGVLDSTWYPYTRPALQRLRGPLIEVRCVVPPEIARRRYAVRSGSRHAGHLDSARLDEELWDPLHSQPLGVGPCVEVDTSRAVSIPDLAARIQALAGAGEDERK
jgi:predicted kinase